VNIRGDRRVRRQPNHDNKTAVELYFRTSALAIFPTGISLITPDIGVYDPSLISLDRRYNSLTHSLLSLFVYAASQKPVHMLLGFVSNRFKIRFGTTCALYWCAEVLFACTRGFSFIFISFAKVKTIVQVRFFCVSVCVQYLKKFQAGID